MMRKPVICTTRVDRGNDFTAEFCLDPMNRRLRVDDYEGHLTSLCCRVLEIAKENAFTKIFVKSHEEDWVEFLSAGYMLEGIYKAYFDGRDAYCMALYLDPGRRTSDDWIEEDRILRQVLALPDRPPEPAKPQDGYVLRPASAEDAVPLAMLYGQVFRSYPTPMSDPSYVGKVIAGGTVFSLIEKNGRLLSAASAEINAACRNAEVTDCVTLPEERGKGLMRWLIRDLEEELGRRSIRSAYSLSRALSFGMNAALFQSDYRYYGRLTKNCDIYGKFEDMNLWVKILASS